MENSRNKRRQGELPLLMDGKTFKIPMTREGEYPKPFKSEKISTGSMTIDSGQTFYVTLDDDGFCATREVGPWSPDDLFEELSYWPETVVWASSAARLDQLLRELAKANGLNHVELFTRVVEYFEEYLDLRITTYLAEEKKTAKKRGDLGSLWKKWSDVHGGHRITGIPSPDIGPGCCYNGLDLDFHEGGWKASLYSDAAHLPDMFLPESWTAETFDGLFDAPGEYGRLEAYLHWTRVDLANLLIEDDPRWRPFIELTEDDPRWYPLIDYKKAARTGKIAEQPLWPGQINPEDSQQQEFPGQRGGQKMKQDNGGISDAFMTSTTKDLNFWLRGDHKDYHLEKLLDRSNDWASLDDENLIKLVWYAPFKYALEKRESLIRLFFPLYQLYLQRTDPGTRQWFNEEHIQRFSNRHYGQWGFLPFIYCEPDVRISCNSAAWFSVLHPSTKEDPLVGPQALIRMLENRSAASQVGCFLGFFGVPDRRGLDLLARHRGLLTGPEVVKATHAVFEVQVPIMDFLLDWLDDIAGDPRQEIAFGGIVGLIHRWADSVPNEDVKEYRREYDPDPMRWEITTTTEPFKHFAARVAKRCAAIWQKESEPKILGGVANAWRWRAQQA